MTTEEKKYKKLQELYINNRPEFDKQKKSISDKALKYIDDIESEFRKISAELGLGDDLYLEADHAMFRIIEKPSYRHFAIYVNKNKLDIDSINVWFSAEEENIDKKLSFIQRYHDFCYNRKVLDTLRLKFVEWHKIMNKHQNEISLINKVSFENG